MLARLLRARWHDVETLAGAEDLPEWELAAVVDGAKPSPWLLHRLAPALGWHASDLFVIAGLSLPEDLAPDGPAPLGPSVYPSLLNVRIRL